MVIGEDNWRKSKRFFKVRVFHSDDVSSPQKSLFQISVKSFKPLGWWDYVYWNILPCCQPVLSWIMNWEKKWEKSEYQNLKRTWKKKSAAIDQAPLRKGGLLVEKKTKTVIYFWKWGPPVRGGHSLESIYLWNGSFSKNILFLKIGSYSENVFRKYGALGYSKIWKIKRGSFSDMRFEKGSQCDRISLSHGSF